MSLNTDKINLLGMSQDMLEQFFAARDEKPFRARQILQWIYQRGVTDFDEMTDLSKKLRDRLKEEAEIVLPELQSRHDSKDGTVKWLFATDCGQAVETVFFLPRLAARLTALFARRERKASIAT
jgi:23S rRNA (adenine2503-C2)-methyltransferase